jgi:hypothetical protein
MKILSVIILLILTTSSYAFSGREVYSLANMKNKVRLLEEYKAFYSEFQKEEALSDLTVKTQFMDYFISSAWAASELNCIYAGWPSKRINNVCSSPARHNPDYQSGSCQKNQLQCQPLLFGKGLCVPASTPSQRSMAFTNCDKKKTVSTEALVKEIRADGNEKVLFELMDFADKICSEGKQSGTGMCRRLEASVDRLRHFKNAAAIEVTSTETLNDRVPAVESVVKPSEKTLDEAIDLEHKMMLETMSQATEAVQSVAAEDCPPEESGEAFDRDEPRPLNVEYVTSKTAPAGTYDNTFVKDKSGELRPTGFELMNIGPNSIAPEGIDPREKAERTWTFTSKDNSRRETYLWITDDPGSGYLSDLMESIILLVPRKVKPKVEPIGDDLHVTLTTGEKVIFDAKTKSIKSGSMQEGKIDTNKDKHARKFASINYSGTGISIRVNKRAEDPRLISGNAVVTQNGKSCQVPAREFWTSDSDFRYAEDKKLMDFLNKKCGNKFSL